MNDAILTKPPKSFQSWATPPEFIEAVARRFGRPDFDLAATAENAKAPRFFTEADDALKQDWADLRCDNDRRARVVFCNPPYSEISPWVEKAAACRDLPRWTLLLLPASVGSLWWVRHVTGKAHWDGIPRIQFVDAPSLYPKDLAVISYGFGVHGYGYWDWRKQP